MANNSFMTKKGLFTISHTFDQSKLQSIYIYNRDITVLMKHVHIKKIKNKILCDIVFLYLLIVPKQRKLEAGDYILSPRILQNSSMLFVYHYFTFHGHSSRHLFTRCKPRFYVSTILQ